MMLSIEYIIAKILLARPDLTKEEILRAIEERERRAKGFLTRESAALSLAAELGIAIESDFKCEMQIKNLIPGLHDVTIAGRVIYVSPLRKYHRSDGKEVISRSVYISDGTGIAKVNLWGDKAVSFNPEDLIGKIMRFFHLSVRRKSENRAELNSRLKSKIEVHPADIRDDDYPPLIQFTKKISELPYSKNRLVNVLGVIKRVYPITIFKRQSGEEGKVRRIEISDGTGDVILVLWDEMADIISDVHMGRHVILFGVKVKERFGGIELHTEKKTEIAVLKEKTIV